VSGFLRQSSPGPDKPTLCGTRIQSGSNTRTLQGLWLYRFQQDWGIAAAHTGKFAVYKFVPFQILGQRRDYGCEINGGKTPIFLWVDRKTQKIDFSPVELYRPIWDTRWDPSHRERSGWPGLDVRSWHLLDKSNLSPRFESD